MFRERLFTTTHPVEAGHAETILNELDAMMRIIGHGFWASLFESTRGNHPTGQVFIIIDCMDTRDE